MSATINALDEVDYKNGPKNHWRRTMWNAIKERLPAGVPAQDAIVLYLAGESDCDRPVALSKGFRHENLIAVDKSLRKVRALRKRGVFAIQGDFIEVVQAWSGPLHVIYGDFCCGLESIFLISQVNALAYLRQCFETVIAANFLRGRDASSNGMRRSFANLNGVQDKFKKHRAALFVTMFVKSCFAAKKGKAVMLRQSARGELLVIRDELTVEDMRELAKEAHQYEVLINAKLFSYRSPAGQTFDSCVLSHPFKSASGRYEIVDPTQEWRRQHPDLCRRIAATLAHRTMRRSAA